MLGIVKIPCMTAGTTDQFGAQDVWRSAARCHLHRCLPRHKDDHGPASGQHATYVRTGYFEATLQSAFSPSMLRRPTYGGVHGMSNISRQNVDWKPLICHRWRGNHERHNGTGLPRGQHDLSRVRSRDWTVRTGERPSGGARGEPRRPPPRAARLLHSCRARDELSQRGLHEGTCLLFPRLSRTVVVALASDCWD